MFVLIYGSRVIRLKVGVGKFHCPHCQSPQPFKHFRFTRFFTLYYIPLFPLSAEAEQVECGQCGMEYNSNVLRDTSPGFAYEARTPYLNSLVMVAAVIVALLALSAINTVVSNNQAAQERTAIAATNSAVALNYGQSNLELCREKLTKRSADLPPNAHFLAVNAETLSMWGTYQQLLPASRQAQKQADLTHIICLNGHNEKYDMDEYGDEGSAQAVYTCARYQYIMDVALVDVRARRINRSWSLEGSVPAECPDETDRNLTRYGNPLTPEKIMAELDLR